MRVFAKVQGIIDGQRFTDPRMSIEVENLQQTWLEKAFESDFRASLSGEITEFQVSDIRVPVRSVRNLLLRYLSDQEDTNIHWINVVGEDSLQPEPELMISLETLQNEMFNVLVQNGWSEGTLLYVCAQKDRYKPADQTILLQCKTLNGMKQSIAEIQAIMRFFGDELWRNPELTAKPSRHFGQS